MFNFHQLMYDDIVRRKKVTPALIFFFFLLSFVLARLTAWQILPYFPLYIKDYHIHHFFYGIFLIVISNWIALVADRENLKRLSAAILGVGLGFIIDEMGLLLTCTADFLICDYDARITYDFVIIISLIFFMIIFFEPIFENSKKISSNIFKFKNK